MRSLLISLVTGLLCSCTHSLQGKLVTEDGAPGIYQDGKVNITDLEDTTKNQILDISAQGTFSSSELEIGKYYFLEALVPGYKSEGLRILSMILKKSDFL